MKVYKSEGMKIEFPKIAYNLNLSYLKNLCVIVWFIRNNTLNKNVVNFYPTLSYIYPKCTQLLHKKLTEMCIFKYIKCHLAKAYTNSIWLFCCSVKNMSDQKSWKLIFYIICKKYKIKKNFPQFYWFYIGRYKCSQHLKYRK